MCSPMRKDRLANAIIRRVDNEKTGVNGVGKPFALRPEPKWTILLALKFGPNGRTRNDELRTVGRSMV